MSVASLLVALLLSLGTSGPEQNDLRLTIACVESVDSQPESPEFAITLENQGEVDWVVNLGFMLANGRTMFPTAVTVLLTDPSGGTRTLHFREPPGVAGRIDDYVVALRSHASYVLRVPLSDYRSTPDLRGPELLSGTYTIQATFEGTGERSVNGDTQGIRLLHFWTGIVSSNVLRFSVP